MTYRSQMAMMQKPSRLISMAEIQQEWCRPRAALRRFCQGPRTERGQSAIEMVLLLGLLAAMAIYFNAQLAPVLLDAFEAVGKSLSSVGP